MDIYGMACAELVPAGSRIERIMFRSGPEATVFSTYREALFDAIVRNDTDRTSETRPLTVEVLWDLSLPDTVDGTVRVSPTVKVYDHPDAAASHLGELREGRGSVPTVATAGLAGSTIAGAWYSTFGTAEREWSAHSTRAAAMEALLDTKTTDWSAGPVGVNMLWRTETTGPGSVSIQVAQFVYESRSDMEADFRVVSAA